MKYTFILGITCGPAAVYMIRKRILTERKKLKNTDYNSRVILNNATTESSNIACDLQFCQDMPCAVSETSLLNDDLLTTPIGYNFNDSYRPKRSAFLDKPVILEPKNLTVDLYSNAETQTIDMKQCNMTDIFGQRYQYQCYLDNFNRTLSWDKSDSKLTLPASAVEHHKVEVHASTFDDIPAVVEKFSLSADTRIASPVVEYRLTGLMQLCDYALVELPFIGETEAIDIWKCPSDGGLFQTMESQKVPVLKHENTDYDLYCVLEEGKVRIYTKSFSVFFCTKHGARDDFCLQTFLFGSFKKISKYEVRLCLYIADELHKFTDYKQVRKYIKTSMT